MKLTIAAMATALLCCPVAVASAETQVADDLNAPMLPTFALAAPPSAPSPWTGLYVGTEVFGIAGDKGVRGGFGGGGFAGYDRELDNGLVVGLRGSAGYVPGSYNHSPVTGFNYAATDVKIGYDMGRLMPFVTAGVGLARPNLRTAGGYAGVTNAASDLFNSTGDLRSFQTVGAGFAYRLSEKMTVELAVQAYRGNGFVGP